MNILILDNYDSFTFNLYHYIEGIIPSEYTLKVKRNDEIDINDIKKYDKILLSPGPGLPEDARINIEVVKRYHKEKSIFGVCLGHQAIALAFGAHLRNLGRVLHGVAIETYVLKTDSGIFKDCIKETLTGRYHSWVIEEESLPSCLEVIARDKFGEIMAIKHRNYDVCGVQFHPESILTTEGRKMMNNWVSGV